MSDPLSVIVNVITLLDIGARCARHVQRLVQAFRQAPEELLALSNEVNDLKVVLTEVERTCQSYQNANILPHMQTINALNTQLDAAKGKLVELEKLIASLYVTSSSGRTKVDKTTWLSKRAIAMNLQEDLKGVRESIHALLNISTAAGSVRIELSLDALRTSFSQNQNDILSQLGQASTSQTSQRASLEQLVQQSFTHIRHELSLYHRETNRRLDQVSTQGLNNHVSLNRVLDTVTGIQSNIQAANEGLQPQVLYHSAQQVRFTMRGLWKCQSGCHCACHIRKEFRTPNYFGRIIGTLFIGYSGFPIIGSKCTEEQCQKYSSKLLQVTYFFPLWFLARAIFLIAGTPRLGEPTFGLTVRRRVTGRGSHDFFNLTALGNTQGVVSLIENRSVHPNDIQIVRGYTALHLAVENYRFDIIAILLAAGADMYIDTGRLPPIMMACNRVLLETANPEQRQKLERLFPLSEGLELWEFTRIHKTVLKILNLQLETELENPFYRTQINSTDSQAAGAHVHARTKLGHEVIYDAFLGSAKSTVVEALISAGASINSLTKFGGSPLNAATGLNRCDLGDFCMQQGADINHVDNDGDSALFETVIHGSHNFLKLLLNNGADHKIVNKSGFTILHQTVMVGDVKTARILANARLGGIDTEARDKAGRKASEYLNIRAGKPEGFDEAIEQLIQSIREANRDDQDEFIDAVEVQDASALN